MTNRIPQPPRFFLYRWKIYFNWKIERTEWNNEHIDNRLWQCVSEYFVFFGFFGFYPKIFGRDSIYYDGHTVESFSLFGLIIGRGFSYNSKELG